MAPIFKSLLVSLAIASFTVLQVTTATPCAGVGDYSDSSCDGSDSSSSSETCVPVSPVKITPETDFLPINNVQPIVNVLPTHVHDYSGEGCYDCDGEDEDYDCSGAYGHGLGHYGCYGGDVWGRGHCGYGC